MGAHALLITDDVELEEFADRASASPVLAVDTEFVREKTYYPRLCLVQLSTEREQAVVDPLAGVSPAPVARLLSNPFVTKVFHACSQDMEALQRWCGALPSPIFDTQVAESFLSDKHQIGYGALVEERCGVSLPKAESMTDWARRPLDETQLEYAVDDVRYLPGIWRSMTEELERAGRSSWVEPEFRRAEDPAAYRHDPRQAFQHLKRTGGLSRRQLAVAREVAQWRELRAQELDVPRRRVLSDELVVEAAKRSPSDMGSLLKVRGMADVPPADRAQILAACRRGLACPAQECPAHERRLRPTPENESVCDMMSAVVRLVAEREGVAPAVIASRDDLMAYLLEGPEGSPISSGWRRELVGRALDGLLAGEVGLTVARGRVELI